MSQTLYPLPSRHPLNRRLDGGPQSGGEEELNPGRTDQYIIPEYFNQPLVSEMSNKLFSVQIINAQHISFI
jgi:hypothetical protein